ASFAIPYVSDPGFSFSGGRVEIVSLSPFVTKVNTNTGAPLNSSYQAPYNNLGIPGAFTYDILNASSASNCFTAINANLPNPLFDLVLRGQGNQFQQAKALSPTFVTLWIGSNDVLYYEITGGQFPITPVTAFSPLFNQICDSLALLGAKVAVANIAMEIASPFLETVTGQLLQQGVTQLWAVKGSGDTSVIDLRTGNFVLLSASSLLTNSNGTPTGIGTSKQNPLPNSAVLDFDEYTNIVTAVNAYNVIIAAAASNRGFALVDIASLYHNIKLSEATGGTTIDGVTFTTRFVNGGLISLDGFHPTAQGYAVIANEFIKTINQKWGVNIEMINVSTIPGSLKFDKNLDKSGTGIPYMINGKITPFIF
ncbi:MAG: SGNH/GDSL hydrolase family protein, partial [Ignavibacteriaceae bacterium]